jgi:hypothetical protein
MNLSLIASARRALLVGVALMIATAPFAVAGQEREIETGKWYPTLETGLNLTQSSYTENWSGGDRGSIVWSWILNGALENQLNDWANWDNTLKLAFGHTHRQEVDGNGNRFWDKPEKSTDLIDLESVLRLTLGGFIDPFVAGRFKSQFLDASDPGDRDLRLNPITIKETAGIARQWINEEERNLLSRLGFTLRQNVRKSFLAAPPDDATETDVSNDGGLELVNDFKTSILNERVTWSSRLGFYQPVFYSGKDELEDAGEEDLIEISDFTTTIDIDWENIFTTQITEMLSVNLYTLWVYDKYDNSVLPIRDEGGSLSNSDKVRAAVRKAGQFKQTLAIGITYRFL